MPQDKDMPPHKDMHSDKDMHSEYPVSESGAVDILEMSHADLAQFDVVDIREHSEDQLNLLQSLLQQDVVRMPLSETDFFSCGLQKGKRYLFVSQRGVRSGRLVSQLRASGFSKAFFVSGGVEAIRRKYIA